MITQLAASDIIRKQRFFKLVNLKILLFGLNAKNSQKKQLLSINCDQYAFEGVI